MYVSRGQGGRGLLPRDRERERKPIGRKIYSRESERAGDRGRIRTTKIDSTTSNAGEKTTTEEKREKKRARRATFADASCGTRVGLEVGVVQTGTINERATFADASYPEDRMRDTRRFCLTTSFTKCTS